MRHLAEWLAFLGIGEQDLARDLSISHNTLAAAIKRGSRSPRWLDDAAMLIGVPAEVLTLPPDCEAARMWRARALGRTALRRLRRLRQARPT